MAHAQRPEGLHGQRQEGDPQQVAAGLCVGGESGTWVIWDLDLGFGWLADSPANL
jgi:hypothetical protein